MYIVHNFQTEVSLLVPSEVGAASSIEWCQTVSTSSTFHGITYVGFLGK